MKDGTFVFPIVLHEEGAFANRLEVGPSPSDFIFPSVPGPLWRDDEELVRSREVVDVF